MKGHWKVFLEGKLIGYVARLWCDQPYHRLLPNGEWSEEAYKTRKEATKALLTDDLYDHEIDRNIKFL